jgi:DNA-directed RNA polymerase specialized sigma24 family protein
MEVRSRGCIDRKEFWETFRSCLEELPQRVADVFMLREMEEMETVHFARRSGFLKITFWSWYTGRARLFGSVWN